jgi:hypothetical protein
MPIKWLIESLFPKFTPQIISPSVDVWGGHLHFKGLFLFRRVCILGIDFRTHSLSKHALHRHREWCGGGQWPRTGAAVSGPPGRHHSSCGCRRRAQIHPRSTVREATFPWPRASPLIQRQPVSVCVLRTGGWRGAPRRRTRSIPSDTRRLSAAGNPLARKLADRALRPLLATRLHAPRGPIAKYWRCLKHSRLENSTIPLI